LRQVMRGPGSNHAPDNPRGERKRKQRQEGLKGVWDANEAAEHTNKRRRYAPVTGGGRRTAGR
jgi:hypothetical protein